MREIEIKAKVHELEKILAALKVNGIVLGGEKKQHDVVFCKPGQKEYEPNSQWLRIRTENDSRTIFTLKMDTGRKLDSIEHETEVSDAKELEAMLRLMGNEVFSDITKVRQKGKYGNIEVCLDRVENLGTYLEAEILAEDGVDAQKIMEELWAFFDRLGISRDDEETLGYDVLYKRKHETLPSHSNAC